jgi:hypothetical protein
MPEEIEDAFARLAKALEEDFIPKARSLISKEITNNEEPAVGKCVIRDFGKDRFKMLLICKVYEKGNAEESKV